MFEIQTGCRIHFGLMELADGAPQRFAGLGLSLEQPGFEVRFVDSSGRADRQSLAAAGELDARLAASLRLRQRIAGKPTCSRPELQRTLPLHSGLGGGTQMAAALAVGLELAERFRASRAQAIGPDWLPVSELVSDWNLATVARHSGRGLRSAIGLYGFLHGGLVLDEGYDASLLETQSRSFTCHSEILTDAWRVLLIQPTATRRVHGEAETQLLAQIGAAANVHREAMYALAKEMLEVTQSRGSFLRFTELLDHYMSLAAEMFHGVQGGKYNGAEAEQAVAEARCAGLRGVGQSSWGPTVFGFAPDPESAQRMQAALVARLPAVGWKVCISRPARRGAMCRSTAL